MCSLVEAYEVPGTVASLIRILQNTETLVPFCQTTLYHNPEGHSINNFVRFFKRLIECRKEGEHFM
jgi:hypothetical protein